MLVVNRFVVGPDESTVTDFTARARGALAVLAGRPGFVRGQLGRAYDDPERWELVTEWESVGAYRRALSAFDVKIEATPLLAESLDEASAFEVLLDTRAGGPVVPASSDRAADPAGALRSGS